MTGKTILITGGTGSFGRAFIRTLLATEPVVRLVSVSRNAELRYELEQAHATDVHAGRLIVLPGDVRQIDDLEPAFQLGVDLVVHAAAEKHIGTGQRYAHYTWGVNIGGAYSVIALARQFNVPRVVALSTDKACEPVNYYGITKRAAETAFLAADSMRDGTRFALVRYGNVVASSGSVIPLFIQQRESGRLTVTDRRMTRFFMPLTDPPFCEFPVLLNGQPVISAVRLVRLALREMQGGEIFVPPIPSANIQQLAEQIAPSCVIDEIGIRDGEKLHEQLIAANEAARTWRRPDGVYVILPEGRAPQESWIKVPAGFTYASDQTVPFNVTEAVVAV